MLRLWARLVPVPDVLPCPVLPPRDVVDPVPNECPVEWALLDCTLSPRATPVSVALPKNWSGTATGRSERSRPELRIRFTSSILPKWARRSKSLDALLPVLYLRGVSTGDFQEALAALLGKDAPNLSAAVIARLTAEWQADYDTWQKRDLSARRYVYVIEPCGRREPCQQKPPSSWCSNSSTRPPKLGAD